MLGDPLWHSKGWCAGLLVRRPQTMQIPGLLVAQEGSGLAVITDRTSGSQKGPDKGGHASPRGGWGEACVGCSVTQTTSRELAGVVGAGLC